MDINVIFSPSTDAPGHMARQVDCLGHDTSIVDGASGVGTDDRRRLVGAPENDRPSSSPRAMRSAR